MTPTRTAAVLTLEADALLSPATDLWPRISAALAREEQARTRARRTFGSALLMAAALAGTMLLPIPAAVGPTPFPSAALRHTAEARAAPTPAPLALSASPLPGTTTATETATPPA